MYWRGKITVGIFGMILGDLLGLPLGGLLGFLSGAFLGHFIFDKPKEEASERQFKEHQRRKGRFIHHVFTLCAKIAKADGRVSQNEIRVMERLMQNQFRLTDKNRSHAIKTWKAAKESSTPFEDYARAFFSDFGKERNKVLDMMHLLFETAAADGNLHPRKEELLHRAAGIFHISRLQYDRIKSRFFQMPKPKWARTDPFYAILGAEPHETMESIKKKYRELAKKWHPDRMTANGSSPEAVKHAKEKFQQINEAYERIVEARKS